jgi:hypothetical protein
MKTGDKNLPLGQLFEGRENLLNSPRFMRAVIL